MSGPIFDHRIGDSVTANFADLVLCYTQSTVWRHATERPHPSVKIIFYYDSVVYLKLIALVPTAIYKQLRAELREPNGRQNFSLKIPEVDRIMIYVSLMAQPFWPTISTP